MYNLQKISKCSICYFVCICIAVTYVHYNIFCLISDEQYNLGLLTRWGWGTDGDRSPSGGVDCSTPQGRRHRIPGQGAPHQNQGVRRGTASHLWKRTVVLIIVYDFVSVIFCHDLIFCLFTITIAYIQYTEILSGILCYMY